MFLVLVVLVTGRIKSNPSLLRIPLIREMPGKVTKNWWLREAEILLGGVLR